LSVEQKEAWPSNNNNNNNNNDLIVLGILIEILTKKNYIDRFSIYLILKDEIKKFL
jgi:hypothetical protein